MLVDDLPTQARSQSHFVPRAWLLCNRTGHPIEAWRETDRIKKQGECMWASWIQLTLKYSAIPPHRFVLLPNIGWESQATGGWELVLFIRDSNLYSQGSYSLQRHSSQMSLGSILTSTAYMKPNLHMGSMAGIHGTACPRSQSSWTTHTKPKVRFSFCHTACSSFYASRESANS